MSFDKWLDDITEHVRKKQAEKEKKTDDLLHKWKMKVGTSEVVMTDQDGHVIGVMAGGGKGVGGGIDSVVGGGGGGGGIDSWYLKSGFYRPDGAPDLNTKIIKTILDWSSLFQMKRYKIKAHYGNNSVICGYVEAQSASDALRIAEEQGLFDQRDKEWDDVSAVPMPKDDK